MAVFQEALGRALTSTAPCRSHHELNKKVCHQRSSISFLGTVSFGHARDHGPANTNTEDESVIEDYFK